MKTFLCVILIITSVFSQLGSRFENAKICNIMRISTYWIERRPQLDSMMEKVMAYWELYDEYDRFFAIGYGRIVGDIVFKGFTGRSLEKRIMADNALLAEIKSEIDRSEHGIKAIGYEDGVFRFSLGRITGDVSYRLAYFIDGTPEDIGYSATSFFTLNEKWYIIMNRKT